MSSDGVSYVTVITGARMNGARGHEPSITLLRSRHSFTCVETEIPRVPSKESSGAFGSALDSCDGWTVSFCLICCSDQGEFLIDVELSC